MADEACLFCRIIKKEIPSKTVFEDAEVMAFEDIKPQAPVHIVIVPKRHIERVADIGAADASLMGKLVVAAKGIAREKGVEASGYRIVFNCNKDAGQEVFHIHAHLLGGRKFAWPPG
ncbi:MAG: histidine triad nucleotide-binding protein [Candidatus Omnitrophica bacterium]|nr:histidine triad nucleotide-binding protein [Candidatus Omnitrophota bacterium]